MILMTRRRTTGFFKRLRETKTTLTTFNHLKRKMIKEGKWLLHQSNET